MPLALPGEEPLLGAEPLPGGEPLPGRERVDVDFATDELPEHAAMATTNAEQAAATETFPRPVMPERYATNCCAGSRPYGITAG